MEVAGLCNVSRVTVEPQVGINGHAKRLELRCDRQSASNVIFEMIVLAVLIFSLISK